MKKVLIALLTFLLSFSCFAYERADLFGSWILSTEVEKVASQRSKIVPLNGIKSVLQSTLIIVPEGESLYVRFAGYGPITITNFMRVSDSQVYIRTRYQTKTSKEPLITVLDVTFIDDDTIKLKVADPSAFYAQFPKEEVTLYRFHTPQKTDITKTKTKTPVNLLRTPVKGKESWGIIASGTPVIVKEKKNDWVKIELDGFPDGWIFAEAVE